MEVKNILKAKRIFYGSLVVKSNSSYAISRTSSSVRSPWRYHFYINEIRFLVSSLQIPFKHVGRSANIMEDALAKQGVDRSIPLVVPTLHCFFLFSLGIILSYQG